jgi:alpha-L-fucosidase
MPMEQPKMKNKGGNTMYFDSSLVITFGNIANASTNKIKAVKNGKEVEFAKRTKVSIDKNHITGISTKGSVIMTPHGFIADDKNKKALEQYKKDHSEEWVTVLGSGTFEVIEEDTLEDVATTED